MATSELAAFRLAGLLEAWRALPEWTVDIIEQTRQYCLCVKTKSAQSPWYVF